MSKFSDRATILPSAKFPAIGAKVSGTVEALATKPVPDFDENTGRMQGVRQLATGGDMTQLDVTLNTPTGRVVLHTKGGIFEAIDAALSKAKLDDLLTGYNLTVEYVGDGLEAASGFAPKLYSATVSK